MKLPHGGGDTGRAPPKIYLGESSKKDNTDRERLARPQGRPIKETFDRGEGIQWERVLLPTHEHYVQEDLHPDGSPILHNGGTPATGRYSTRGHPYNKVEQQHKAPNNTRCSCHRGLANPVQKSGRCRDESRSDKHT